MKTIIISVLASISVTCWSAELVHQFNSPAFSGIGWSAHVLTIEQMEAARTQKNKDENKAAQDKADRDAKNTNLAKFLVNVESRIYAQPVRTNVQRSRASCFIRMQSSLMEQ